MERDYRIKIYTLPDVPEESVLHIDHGIEEEGLFCDVLTCESDDDLTMQVYAAACRSPLEIAVGINREHAFLLHRKASADREILSGKSAAPEALRRLGQNAARLVSGRPLLL